MCDIITEDIAGACEPIAGVAMVLYYAQRSDFEAVVDPPAPGVVGAFATKATITGPHTFKAGKGFNKLKITSKTGTIKSTQGSESKRRMFTNEFGGQVAGSEAALLGFMRMVKNGDFIVIAVEVGSGRARQLGSDRFFAEFTAQEHSIEATPDGLNALTFTIQDMQPWPAPVYVGAIATVPVEDEE